MKKREKREQQRREIKQKGERDQQITSPGLR